MKCNYRLILITFEPKRGRYCGNKKLISGNNIFGVITTGKDPGTTEQI